MSEVHSPWTAALLELTAHLSELQRDDDLQGSEWMTAVAEAFMTTPMLTGIDPYLYDALLSWAGFDLRTVEGLDAAAAVTATLTSMGTVSCTEDVDHLGSGVLDLAAVDRFEPQRNAAQQFVDTEEAEALFDLQLERCSRYWNTYVQARIDAAGEGGEAEAA